MKNYFGIIIGILLAVSFSVLAFTEPTVAPPGGNVAAPVNVSGTAQTKSGKLNIGGGLPYWITKIGDSFALENNAGQTALVIGQDGKMGVGTANPGYAFTVAGDVFASNQLIAGSNPSLLALDANGIIQTKGARFFARGFDGGGNYTFTTGGAEPSSVFMGFNGSAGGSANSVTIAPRGNIGVYVTSNGDVGIGTTNPGFKLTVAGKIYSSVGVDGESLCIKGDCKSSWSQVGGGGGDKWGGEYTYSTYFGCFYTNPYTGGCSCPGGYNDKEIHRSFIQLAGTSWWEFLHMCYK